MRKMKKVMRFSMCLVFTLSLIFGNVVSAFASEGPGSKGKPSKQNNIPFTIQVMVGSPDDFEHSVPASGAVINKLNLKGQKPGSESPVENLPGTTDGEGKIQIKVAENYKELNNIWIEFDGKSYKLGSKEFYAFSGSKLVEKSELIKNQTYYCFIESIPTIPIIPTYTVTFVKADGTISLLAVEDGTTLEEKDVPALTANNAQYTYAWDEDPVGFIVTGDKTFTEEATVNQYTVTFVKADGTESTKTVNYGTTLIASDVPALTANNAQYTYGWDENPVGYEVKGDKTFTEKATVNQYTVTFVKADGTTSTLTVDYGTELTASDVPELTANNEQYTYAWDVIPVGTTVKANVTFTEKATVVVPESTTPAGPVDTTPAEKPVVNETPVENETPVVNVDENETPANPADSNVNVNDDKTPASAADDDTLPQTGTASPANFYLFGIAMLALGLVVIVGQRKEKRA